MAWHKSKPDALAEKDFVKTVGHQIARYRQARGFTQYELARAAGTARNMISAYECGKTMPSSYTLYKIGETLEVSLDVLCAPLGAEFASV